MTEEAKACLVGHFLRVNLCQRAEFEDYSLGFVTGWCKGAWAEGLLLVDGADVARGGGPFVVPWANVAAIQIDATDNAHDRQREAEAKFEAVR